MPKYIPYFNHKTIQKEYKPFTLFENSDVNLTTNIDNTVNGLNVILRTYGSFDYNDVVQVNEKSTVANLAKVNQHFKYSSLQFLVNKSLNYLKNTYIGAVSITPKQYTNIQNYFYNPFNDTTNFSVLIDNINFSNIRDIFETYSNYFLFEYKDVDYIIEEAIITDSQVIFKVKGDLDTSDTNILAYIKPNELLKETYLSQLDTFESYLINKDKNTYFSIIFENEDYVDGILYSFNQEFKLPKLDKYNIDFTSYKYDIFYNDLFEFATKFDESQTNHFKNKFVGESFYYENDKAEVLSNVWSYHYDIIWQNIKKIQNFYEIRYDMTDSFIIDEHYKKIGFGYTTNNIQLKKILVNNVNFILKSKGTRTNTLNLLNLYGIPNKLLRFNEHIKIVENNTLDANPNVFENEAYWDYYNNVFSETIETTIKDNFTNLDTTNFDLTSLNQCFDYSGTTSNITTVNYLECGCEEVVNRIFTINGNLKPVGCPNIILDVWQTCVSGNNVQINYNILGGEQPYVLSGLTSNIKPKNEYFEFFVIDNNNCTSNVVSGYTNCVSLECQNTNFNVNLDYSCFDVNNGRLQIDITGGIEPYFISGATNNQIVENGDIINLYVKDANNCEIFKTLTINCQTKTCVGLRLNSTIESVNYISGDTYDVNLTYDISNLGFGVYVSQVSMQTTYLSQTFNEIYDNPFGVMNLNVISSNPVDFDVHIQILTSDGCIYEDNFTFNDFVLTSLNVPQTHTNNL